MFHRASSDGELSRSPFCAGLDRRQVAVVSQLSTPVSLRPGRVLVRQGSVGAEFFVVLDGYVDVIRGDELLASRGPGSPLGEIALLGARPRTATLVTRSEVRARVVSQREFFGLLAEVPEVSRRLRATMAQRLAASPRLATIGVTATASGGRNDSHDHV